MTNAFSQPIHFLLESRYLVMKLFYYDDKTPSDYEPPFFRAATDEESFSFHYKPIRFQLGQMMTQYHTLALQVHTTIDSVERLQDTFNRGETKVCYLLHYTQFISLSFLATLRSPPSSLST